MKILNCITNSFFRTIGRILAYLAIGALLVALLSKAHLPSFEEIINDSLFMKVNAEQIVVPVNPRASEYYFGIPNWSSGWTLDSTQNFARTSFWSHDYVQEQWIQFGSDNFTTDVDYLEFTFLANEPYTRTNTNNDNYCIEWDITTYTDIPLSNGDHGILHNVYTCKKYGNNTNNTVYTSSLGNFAMYFEIEYTNGNKPMCTVTGTSIICPTNHLTPYKLHIYTYFNTTLNTAFDFNISRHVRGYYAQNQQQVIDSINNQTSSVINNQNNNTQSVINNQNANTNATIENQNQNTQQITNTLTNNTLNDNEIESELQFDMPNTSLGPFSGFLALPLTWVQSLLSSNNNCSELVLPLPFINQNLTLPCMYTFWQKMGILGTLVQAVWIAVVGVRIFNGLFLLVIEVRSPEGNADYLTKIRSWEL